MEYNKESITALVSCFARGFHARHSSNPIFSDTVADTLLKEEEKKLIAFNWAKACAFFDQKKNETLKNNDEKLAWVMNTQCIPQLVARARYTEDCLARAIHQGVKQYVILGAGMDTFALRQEQLPEDFLIYEVDHPATQTFKINCIQELGIKIPENVKFVPVDFRENALHDELKKAGFAEDRPSFFSLLGVTMYLNKNDFYRLVSLISEMVPTGSSFVFDYLDDAAFDDKQAAKKMQQMRQITAQTGEPIITGFDPLTLDVELQNFHVLLYENLSPENIEERYFHNRNDELHAFDHFHFAHLAVGK
ncbi:class I SAM-dependent methyltransferase [Bacillaceae bacterium Marseille-Q3522]|nr:class I SAM-dependent methyltransferase [Bacillaceae bacterium Marseille-Q3522]